MTGDSHERRYVHPDEGQVYACPQCDYAPVSRRTGNGNATTGNPDHRFVCYECGKTWDHEPPTRPSRDDIAGGLVGGGTPLEGITADDVDALSDLNAPGGDA